MDRMDRVVIPRRRTILVIVLFVTLFAFFSIDVEKRIVDIQHLVSSDAVSEITIKAPVFQIDGPIDVIFAENWFRFALHNSESGETMYPQLEAHYQFSNITLSSGKWHFVSTRNAIPLLVLRVTAQSNESIITYAEDRSNRGGHEERKTTLIVGFFIAILIALATRSEDKQDKRKRSLA